MCFDEFEAQYKLGVSILKITLIVSKLRKKKKKSVGTRQNMLIGRLGLQMVWQLWQFLWNQESDDSKKHTLEGCANIWEGC